ncbi:MAG: signal peptide peptidase SppA, partial [Pseudomonadales bacterium]
DVPQQALVKDIIDALALAKDDKRIGLLVLELDKLEGGLLPKLERVAAAISDFKSSGKKVIAIAQNYSQPALLLAVQADKVLLNPEGIAVPEGFGMFRTYYKTLLDNADVSINLFKVGKYKSAVEPFFRDSMSDEDREARLAIMDKWWDAYTGAVETTRGLDKGSLNTFLHDAPNQIRLVDGNLSRLALKKGLVDRLVSDDERRTYLIELAGEDKENNEYRGLGYEEYLGAVGKPEKQKSSRVAVITAVGTIVDGDADPGGIGSETLTKLIRKALQDDKVKAIVLRVDSGGGSKTASEIIRRELQAAQEAGIPVVASMGSVAASGGYWISATADEIWALPTTITGSIGIFGLIPSFEKTLARYGVHSDGVATTPIVGGASLARGVSPVYGEVLQTVIEAGYQQFLTTVAKGRNMDSDAVHEIAQGRVWTGEKALELGLVDHMGDLEQAIEAAARLADVEDYSVWYVEPERSIEELVLRELMSAVSIARPQANIDSISQIVQRMRQDLNFIGRLNDPSGAYVICGGCPVGP